MKCEMSEKSPNYVNINNIINNKNSTILYFKNNIFTLIHYKLRNCKKCVIFTSSSNPSRHLTIQSIRIYRRH